MGTAIALDMMDDPAKVRPVLAEIMAAVVAAYTIFPLRV